MKQSVRALFLGSVMSLSLTFQAECMPVRIKNLTEIEKRTIEDNFLRTRALASRIEDDAQQYDQIENYEYYEKKRIAYKAQGNEKKAQSNFKKTMGYFRTYFKKYGRSFFEKVSKGSPPEGYSHGIEKLQLLLKPDDSQSLLRMARFLIQEKSNIFENEDAIFFNIKNALKLGDSEAYFVKAQAHYFFAQRLKKNPDQNSSKTASNHMKKGLRALEKGNQKRLEEKENQNRLSHAHSAPPIPYFEFLPNELLDYLADFLDDFSCVQLSATSHHLREAIDLKHFFLRRIQSEIPREDKAFENLPLSTLMRIHVLIKSLPEVENHIPLRSWLKQCPSQSFEQLIPTAEVLTSFKKLTSTKFKSKLSWLIFGLDIDFIEKYYYHNHGNLCVNRDQLTSSWWAKEGYDKKIRPYHLRLINQFPEIEPDFFTKFNSKEFGLHEALQLNEEECQWLSEIPNHDSPKPEKYIYFQLLKRKIFDGFYHFFGKSNNRNIGLKFRDFLYQKTPNEISHLIYRKLFDGDKELLRQQQENLRAVKISVSSEELARVMTEFTLYK